MKPVLKYRGGKSQEIPHILPYIPETYNRYIEPFFGGGALFFFLEPRTAIINDTNAKLITFYRQLRDEYSQLRAQLDELQTAYERNQAEFLQRKAESPDGWAVNENEALYYRIREQFNHPDGRFLDGAVYFFINKTAYSGMIRYNSKGEYNVPFGRYPHLNTELASKEHCLLLQRAELFCQDYSAIFQMAKPDDFMFLDPPYDCVFNDYGNLGQKDGFDETEQRRLAEDFRNLSCKTLMVIGKTPLTEELYGKYVAEEYHKSYSVNIRNRFNSEKMHLIVKNY